MLLKNRLSGITLGFTASSILLTGCSTFTAETDDALEYRKQSANALYEESRSVKRHSLFNEVDGVYLGKLSYGVNAEPKPQELNNIIYYDEISPISLEFALNRISYDTGINIYFADDALVYLGLDEVEDEVQEEESPARTRLSPESSQLTEAIDKLRQTTESLAEKKAREDFSIDISKIVKNDSVTESIILKAKDITLEDWLNDFTLERGLFWEYGEVAGKPYVEISATMSETIQFEGIINVIGDDGVEDSASKAWTEIKDFAEKMKTEVGFVSTSDATGRIYVKDRPSVINEIKKRIRYENDVFNQMIYYDLRVLTFRQSENENIQLNWNVVYENLSESIGMTTPSSEAVGFGTSYAFQNPNSNFAGTDATATALKSLLKGARESSANGSTRNRTVFTSSPKLNAKIVTGTEVTASETGTVVSDVTGDVVSGIDFDLYGSIMSGGKIAIDMSITYDDEISRETRSGQNGDITLPTTYTVPLAPQFVLRPGETAIFATSTSNMSSNRTGPHGDLGWINILFGGNRQTIKEETLTVIIVEAKIVGQ